MTTRVTVGPAGSIPPGQCITVDTDTGCIAVYNVGGALYAINNTCPHRGGPLAEGLIEGSLVTCPWHAWQFDVTTGASPLSEDICVPAYPVTVDHGRIVVDLHS